MGPRIKRSIVEGFRAANRSWLGIGFFAAGLAAVTVLAIGLVMVTNPPPELFEEPGEPAAAAPAGGLMESAFAQEPEGSAPTEQSAAQPEETPAATEPEPAPAPAEPAATPAPSAAPPEAPPAATEPEPVPADEGEANLFDELGETTPPPPAAVAPAATADDEARSRVIGQWFGRAWPLLLLALLLAASGNVWLNGGQIGYLAKQVTGQRAPVSEFWVVGTRAFLPLIGAWALSLLGVAGAVGILALVAALLAVLPEAARTVVGGLVVIALLAGFIWLIVRLAFWFIAVVVERIGPIAALKASFRATRGNLWKQFGLIFVSLLIVVGLLALFNAMRGTLLGVVAFSIPVVSAVICLTWLAVRWWRLAGLGLLMALISYVAWLPFALVEWLGVRIGGGAAIALGLVGNVGGIIVSLYVGFAALAAYLRFYEDTKAVPSVASPTAP